MEEGHPPDESEAHGIFFQRDIIRNFPGSRNIVRDVKAYPPLPFPFVFTGVVLDRESLPDPAREVVFVSRVFDCETIISIVFVTTCPRIQALTVHLPSFHGCKSPPWSIQAAP